MGVDTTNKEMGGSGCGGANQVNWVLDVWPHETLCLASDDTAGNGLDLATSQFPSGEGWVGLKRPNETCLFITRLNQKLPPR